jgi:hypothetical protein
MPQGSIRLCGRLSYAPQIPWIQQATVRDNILFGTEYDKERYFHRPNDDGRFQADVMMGSLFSDTIKLYLLVR